MFEFIGGVIMGIFVTLATREWLDMRRASEIRDNTIQMSKMEQRIMMSVKHLMQKSKEEK
jgi:hypothetical protein